MKTHYPQAASSVAGLSRILAVTAMLILGSGCGDSKKADVLADDSTLARDIQLANQGGEAQAKLTDTATGALEQGPPLSPEVVVRTPEVARQRGPVTQSRPARTRVDPRAGAVVPARDRTTSSGNTETRNPGTTRTVTGTVAAGTELALTSNSRICTNTARVGERFRATLSEAVFGSNGTVIPAGATANVEVTELSRSENANDRIRIGLRVLSITSNGKTYPVEATTTTASIDRIRNQPRSKDVQKVATGAAIGAIAGQILGGSTKATVIGGAVGAAAGAGAASATANYEGCLPEGGRITARLDRSTQIQD